MLSIKELQQRAPAAFATAPAAHCSPGHAMLPTIEAIEALAGEGFTVVDARQDSTRPSRWHNELNARHVVRMRMSTGGAVAKRHGVLPEVVITNSSNGSCPFEMYLGMLRQVCSNGLVVFDKIEAFHFVHRRVTAEQVIARARALSANTKPLFDKIDRWSKTPLVGARRKAFAEQALTLRVGEERAKLYDPDSLLTVQRPEDEGDSLWLAFNRAQENGMRGSISGRAAVGVDSGGTGRTLSGRPIVAIGTELRFNLALWSLAESFA